MSGIGGFRGVSASQDARFVNKQKRMLKTKKFPKELDLVVDYARINWPVIREWTAKRVTELLGVEDEVLIQFIHNRFEDPDLNPKELYLEMMPFLEKNTGLFMKELWVLLASATASETGIPQQILDAKAEEVQRKLDQQSTIMESIKEQRNRIEQEIESKATNQANMDVEEDPDKKEKGKRWAPPALKLREPEQAAPVVRSRETGFSGGVGEHERNQRKKWQSRTYSPRRRRSERDRHSERKRHASRSLSRSPRRRHANKNRHREKTRFFPHTAANGRSPGRERRRKRRSTSPKSQRHRRQRFQRHDAEPRMDDKKQAQGSPFARHSFSRSPPDSRHESPPPRAYNLGLARQKREHHDRKSRSVERQPLSRSPEARSPSPRSRNRMSSTPELREATPSPSTPVSQQDAQSSRSPIPKPPTPRTLTPPIRYPPECEPHGRRKDTRRAERNNKPFGTMYGFRDDEDEMHDRDLKAPPFSHGRRHSDTYRSHRDCDEMRRRDDRFSMQQRSPRLHQHHRHKSMDVRKRSGRRDYSYMPSLSPRNNKRDVDHYSQTFGREKRLSGLEGSLDRRHDLSDNDSIEKLRDKGDRSNGRSGSPHLDHQRLKRRSSPDTGRRSDRMPKDKSSSFDDDGKNKAPSSGAAVSDESGESSKAKEKLKRKLDEILEKKDSLCLD